MIQDEDDVFMPAPVTRAHNSVAQPVPSMMGINTTTSKPPSQTITNMAEFNDPMSQSVDGGLGDIGSLIQKNESHFENTVPTRPKRNKKADEEAGLQYKHGFSTTTVSLTDAFKLNDIVFKHTLPEQNFQ